MSKYYIYQIDDDDDCSISEFLDSRDTHAEAVIRAKELQKYNDHTVYIRSSELNT